MKIEFSQGLTCFEKMWTKKLIKGALVELNQPLCVEVCVSATTEEEMQTLNNSTRNVNKVTDVLSFPATNTQAGQIIDPQDQLLIDGVFALGDVVVCNPQIARQAKEYQTTYKKEFCRMVLHSVLHLLGYDHIEEKDRAVMQPVEQKLFLKLVGKY